MPANQKDRTQIVEKEVKEVMVRHSRVIVKEAVIVDDVLQILTLNLHSPSTQSASVDT
jgi:hypothetical protein